MTVAFVPISQIDPPAPVLRLFSETELSFLELVEQIKYHRGSLQAPPARLRPGGRYQLVDGNRRYKATRKAGLEKMPIRVVELTDTEYLAAQIACNSQHKDTDWVDFAFHLEKLRTVANEEMTISEMADLCKKSTSWIKKILRLKNLSETVRLKVQRNEMPIGNAYWLARMPKAEQGRYVEDAMVIPVCRFSKQMRVTLRDYREAVKRGNLDRLGIDELKPQMRDLKIIEAELKTPSYIPVMVASQGIENPIEAAILALKWAFRVDSATIAERKEKMLNYEREKINDAERRKIARDRMRKSEESEVVY